MPGFFYLPPSGRWDLGVEGKNLTDERVLNSGYNGLAFFGYAEGTYNPPRRYWLTFHYHCAGSLTGSAARKRALRTSPQATLAAP